MKKQVKEYTELTVNVRWYEERADYSECISVGGFQLYNLTCMISVAQFRCMIFQVRLGTRDM